MPVTRLVEYVPTTKRTSVRVDSPFVGKQMVTEGSVELCGQGGAVCAESVEINNPTVRNKKQRSMKVMEPDSYIPHCQPSTLDVSCRLQVGI
jgi:hypothetical protein